MSVIIRNIIELMANITSKIEDNLLSYLQITEIEKIYRPYLINRNKEDEINLNNKKDEIINLMINKKNEIAKWMQNNLFRDIYLYYKNGSNLYIIKVRCTTKMNDIYNDIYYKTGYKVKIKDIENDVSNLPIGMVISFNKIKKYIINIKLEHEKNK